MSLGALDWLVVFGYFAVMIGVGLFYRGRAGRNIEEFFVSGRDVPWWLAGTSMVATTFAADTPLAVTGMVAANGVAGNWLWWNFAFSGLLTTFVFAKLWRRAGVLTDVEFAEIRYSGRPAAFLRGFRAVYLALFINSIVLGWVNLAMVKVMTLLFGLSKTEGVVAVLGLIAITSATSSLSGLRGVLVTDLIQFVMMMGVSIGLAWVAVDKAGGMLALKASLAEISPDGSLLAFFPPADSPWMPALTFCVYLAVVWWATWYPGSEPGGGGFVAQRMLSSKDDNSALAATLWFNIAHFALRPWPWIVAALATLVLYPGLDDPETGYVRLMLDEFPASLRGLMIAGFAAAFMSTVSTNLNWGAGCLVNDLYARFWRRDAAQPELVRVSRWATWLLALVSVLVTLRLESVSGAWKLLLATGAGTGGVLILRWLWWRVNAWSEVSAMAAAATVSIGLQTVFGVDSDDPLGFAYLTLITVGVTTVVWLAVTYLTAPEPNETLNAFYLRVRPYRLGWKPFVDRRAAATTTAGRDLASWVLACILVYSAMFGFGKMVLIEPGAPSWLTAAVAAGALLVYLRRSGDGSPVSSSGKPALK